MKNFDQWNKIKKEANKGKSRLYTVREIWWCRLGVNIGTEQDGNSPLFLRPIVIICSFGPTTCLVMPLTTSENKHKLRIPIGKVQNKNASVIMSQIRVVDTRRLVEKVGFLEQNMFETIRKAVRELF